MRITALGDDFLGVETGNNREVENSLRELASARWNGAENRWEVHISHLPDLIGLFRLNPQKLPEDLMEVFERDWLSCEVRVEVNHSSCRILGAGVPTRELDEITSFEVTDRVELLPFLEGEWDGRKHLFDRRSFTFPAGLFESVMALLRERKKRVVVDDRRSPFKESPPPPSSLLDPLGPEDRALVEAVRTGGRLTAIRQLVGGEVDLLRALMHVAGSRATILVPTEEKALLLGERLEGENVRVFRTVKDLDADFLILAVPAAAVLFSHLVREQASQPLSAEEKRRALMVGLRIRRERALIVLRADAIPSETIALIASHAPEAAIRVALSRTPPADSGMDLLLQGGFGPWRTFCTARQAAARNLQAPVHVHHLRAPSYERVERDRAPDEIVRNGIFQNESRTSLLKSTVAHLREEKRPFLVIAETEAYRASLRSTLGESVVIMGVAEAYSAFLRGQLSKLLGAEAPSALIFAEPPLRAKEAARLILTFSEYLAGQVDPLGGLGQSRRGRKPIPADEGPEALDVYDFEDPLPGYRRINTERWALYSQFEGWLRTNETPSTEPVGISRVPVARPAKAASNGKARAARTTARGKFEAPSVDMTAPAPAHHDAPSGEPGRPRRAAAAKGTRRSR